MNELDHLMSRILGRMTLLSDGKASKPAMSSSSGDVGGSSTIAHTKGAAQPILSLAPQDWGWEIRSLQRRYNSANTATRPEIVQEALTLLIRAKHAPRAKGIRGTREWRQKIARDPRSSRRVAILYEVSHSTVLSYRREFSGGNTRSVRLEGHNQNR